MVEPITMTIMLLGLMSSAIGVFAAERERENKEPKWNEEEAKALLKKEISKIEVDEEGGYDTGKIRKALDEMGMIVENVTDMLVSLYTLFAGLTNQKESLSVAIRVTETTNVGEEMETDVVAAASLSSVMTIDENLAALKEVVKNVKTVIQDTPKEAVGAQVGVCDRRGFLDTDRTYATAAAAFMYSFLETLGIKARAVHQTHVALDGKFDYSGRLLIALNSDVLREVEDDEDEREGEVVVLLGDSGVGKSTIGNRIASARARPFLTVRGGVGNLTCRAAKCDGSGAGTRGTIILDTPGLNDPHGTDLYNADCIVSFINALGGKAKTIFIVKADPNRPDYQVSRTLKKYEAIVVKHALQGAGIIVTRGLGMRQRIIRLMRQSCKELLKDHDRVHYDNNERRVVSVVIHEGEVRPESTETLREYMRSAPLRKKIMPELRRTLKYIDISDKIGAMSREEIYAQGKQETEEHRRRFIEEFSDIKSCIYEFSVDKQLWKLRVKYTGGGKRKIYLHAAQVGAIVNTCVIGVPVNETQEKILEFAEENLLLVLKQQSEANLKVSHYWFVAADSQSEEFKQMQKKELEGAADEEVISDSERRHEFYRQVFLNSLE